jgi:hypothetical protein
LLVLATTDSGQLVVANDEVSWDGHRAAAPPLSPPPGDRLSSTMRAFSDDDQRRRRSGPLGTVTVDIRAR